MKIIKKDNIEEVVRFLKKGRVVSLPTDTVYGFLGHAEQGKTVSKIFDIKKREKTNPIGIFVKDLSMAKRYAEIYKREELLQRYWPGKFTFILKKRREFPKGIGTKKTIGIRIPNYDLFDEIFSKINFPLAQTSANLSGRPASLDSEAIIREFKKQAVQPDLVFNVAVLTPSLSSTVVDLTSKNPRVIRKGPVKFKAQT